jgi:hypothetical protein
MARILGRNWGNFLKSPVAENLVWEVNLGFIVTIAPQAESANKKS